MVVRVVLFTVLVGLPVWISSQDIGREQPVITCEQLTEKCEHRCINTTQGARCMCNEGYMLKPDNRRCQDIDECRSDLTPCSQKCSNHRGGYSCECQQGYRLVNGTFCKAVGGGNPRLVYARHAAIEVLDLVTKSAVQVDVPHHKVERIGFYPGSNTVYWIDTLGALETVYRQQLEDLPAQPQPIINQGSGFHALVLDWAYALLYLAKGNTIVVCKINGRHCRTLKKFNNPVMALAIDPSKTTLFFSELGSKPHISRINVGEATGNVAANVVATTNMESPVSLALDNVFNRIYWADQTKQVIEYCDAYEYNVKRKVLLHTTSPPLSITLFEDTIYWSDGEGIRSANKFAGHNRQTMLTGSMMMTGLMIVHPAVQKPLSTPCSPTSCSQLCLPSKTSLGYACACDDQSELEADGVSCRMSRKSAHLLFSSGSQILGMDLHLTRSPDVFKEFPAENIGDLAYDPVTDVMVLVKTKAGTIEKWNINSDSETTVIYDTMRMFVGGLAMDTKHGNVYWTIPQEGEVMAASITNPQPVILRELDGYPTAVAVASQQEMIFVADTKSSCIYQMRLDGSELDILVSSTFPTAFAISEADNILVWSDRQSETTRMIELDGTNDMTAQRFAQSYGAMVLTDGKLYSLPANSTYLYSISNNGHGASQHVPVGNFLNAGGSIRHMAIMLPTTTASSPCRSNSSGCSHFCTTVNNVAKCLCPDGFTLKDGKSCEQTECSHHSFLCQGKCIPRWMQCNDQSDCQGGECLVTTPKPKEKACSEHQWRCEDKEQCIPKQWRCDDGADCKDKSDERNCPDCPESEWRCRTSNKCIPKRWMCNNRYDCDDHSDDTEQLCKNVTCGENEFKCRYGACVEMYDRCDDMHDCLDKSDEEACPKESCDPMFDFKCNNGDCISMIFTCNGRNDCLEGEDEQLPECGKPTVTPGTSPSCHCPQQTHFLCEQDEFLCLPNVKKCNGVVDCASGSDEYSCPSICPANLSLDDCKALCQRNNFPFCHASLQDRPSVVWKPSSCGQETWQCPKSGDCVPLGDVCDGKPDCPDGEDEGPRCDTACINSDCEMNCKETPSGPRCRCHVGFELSRDGKTCTDVDECSSYPGYCSQMCVNSSQGVAQCKCNRGYRLESDGKSCKAEGVRGPVVFAHPQSIESVSLNGHVLHSLVSVSDSVITGLAYDAKRNLIYWSQVRCGVTTVNKMSLQEASENAITEVLSVNGASTALNYDWVNENLVLAVNDSNRFRIMVCSTTSLQCVETIALPKNKEVVSVAVDPRFGKLFWVEKERNNPLSKTAIIQSDLKGLYRESVIVDIAQATHLTVDTSIDKLFWSDSFLSSIHSADITGENQRVVATARNGLSHPRALATFEEGIYFSNMDTLDLYAPAPDCIENTNLTVCNKFNGGGCKNLHQHYMGAHSIVVISKALQPDTFTLCKDINCPSVCIPSDSTAHCLKGKQTKRDGCQIKEVKPKPVTVVASDWSAASTTAKPVPNPFALFPPRIVNNSKKPDEENRSDGGSNAWVAGIVVPLILIVIAAILAIIYRRWFQKPYGGNSRTMLFSSLRFGILEDDELQEQQEADDAEVAKEDKRRKIYPSPLLKNFRKGRVRMVSES